MAAFTLLCTALATSLMRALTSLSHAFRYAQAAAAAEAKSQFLARMSHEIRTPLNGMIAVGQLLAETALSPAQWDLVNTVRCSGETLLTLISDILDFSRIEVLFSSSCPLIVCCDPLYYHLCSSITCQRPGIMVLRWDAPSCPSTSCPAQWVVVVVCHQRMLFTPMDKRQTHAPLPCPGRKTLGGPLPP